MTDFNGVGLEIGDTIFFYHRMSQQVIGKISKFNGKASIYVKSSDFIKVSPSLAKVVQGYKDVNGVDYDLTVVVYARKVIKI